MTENTAPSTKTPPQVTEETKLPPQAEHGKKKSNRYLLWGGILGAILIIGALAYTFMGKTPSTTTTPRVIKLGLIAPLSGDNVNDGQLVKHGIDMARKDFNEEGISFEIIEKDTQCDAKKAAAATQELVAEKVVAIIGESCSGATLGALPVANQNHVVLISAESSSPALTQADDYFFRTYPSDNIQGAYIAKYIYDHGEKRLAIIYSNEAYGAGLDSTAKDNFIKLGGTVVANESFEDIQNISFTKQIQTIKAAKPDALYIITNGKSAAAAIILAAKAQGISVPLYGSETLKDTALLTDVGAASNGLVVTAVTEGLPNFIDQYTAAFGAPPVSAGGAQAYDAFMALAQAVKSGATTSDEIRDALYKVEFDGVSGHIKFDNTGDLDGGNYKLFVVKNGKFEPLDQ